MSKWYSSHTILQCVPTFNKVCVCLRMFARFASLFFSFFSFGLVALFMDQSVCEKCVNSILLLKNILLQYLYYYLRGFSCLDSSFFQFKNAPTPLCLSRDKTKGHFSKNAILISTKILPKKQDYSPVIFQITLSTYKLDSFFKKKKKTYKLDSQNKNTGFFFFFC